MTIELLTDQINTEQTNQIQNRIQLLSHVSEVQSRIKKDISSDFILAKLSDKDKEGVIEMTGNAYYWQKLIKLWADNSTTWKWNDNTKTWIQTGLPPNTMKKIYKTADTLFDTFMIRIYMTVLLNRNVPKNYLINILSSQPEDTDLDEETPTEFKEKIKKVIQNESK